MGSWHPASLSPSLRRDQFLSEGLLRSIKMGSCQDQSGRPVSPVRAPVVRAAVLLFGFGLNLTGRDCRASRCPFFFPLGMEQQDSHRDGKRLVELGWIEQSLADFGQFELGALEQGQLRVSNLPFPLEVGPPVACAVSASFASWSWSVGAVSKEDLKGGPFRIRPVGEG